MARNRVLDTRRRGRAERGPAGSRHNSGARQDEFRRSGGGLGGPPWSGRF